MTSLQVSTVLAGVPVRNMNAAIGWYRLFLGADPDRRPIPQLADRSSHGNYMLQVVPDPDRADGSLISLPAADPGARDKPAGRGIEPTVADTGSDNVLVWQVTDPDTDSVTLFDPKAGVDPRASGGRE